MIITDLVGYGLSSPCIDNSVRYLGYLSNSNLKNIGIIEVHSDNGLVGYGETYAGVYAAELIEPTVNFLKQRLIGYEIRKYKEITKDIYNIPYIGRNGLFASISSGIEIALLDLLAKEEGLPLHRFLDKNSKESVRTYASNGSSMFNPAQIKDDVKTILALGFTAYKMRVGYQSWEEDIKRLEAAREELGDKELMVDSIMGTLKEPWEQDRAERCISEMQRYQVKWFEEPVHPENLVAMSYLNTRFPVAGGEALSGLKEFDEYKRNNAVTFAQPDATHCGGITNCLKIVSRFPRTALHVWGSSAALLANLHVALSSEVEILEYPMMRLKISDEILEEELQWDGDRLKAPTAPGLGIRISEDIKNKYKLASDSNYLI